MTILLINSLLEVNELAFFVTNLILHGVKKQVMLFKNVEVV